MTESFPRKRVYVSTLPSPLRERHVSAIRDREIKVGDFLRGYSEGRWVAENEGWTSSSIPSAVDVEQTQDNLLIHCGLTEYKYLLGMVKLASERGRTGLAEDIHGLSTEIMPLTLDQMFFLDRRSGGMTQHGVGFYDIPTAGQHAQMWIDRIPEEHQGLVKNMLDMGGFPRWNLIRHLGLKQEEIGEIFYTGFSRGFEVSLDSQFNGYTKITPEAGEIMRRSKEGSRLVYNFDDLLDLLDSIGNDGNGGRSLKEDIRGRTPEPTGTGFRIIDDCLGTLLSNTLHLRGKEAHDQVLGVLEGKGYEIMEVSQKRVHLDDLN